MRADAPATLQYAYSFLTNGWLNETAGASCPQSVNARNTQNPTLAPATYLDFTVNADLLGGMCRGTYPSTGTQIYNIASYVGQYYCATGTLSGTNCVGATPPPVCPVGNTYSGQVPYDPAHPSAANVCFNSCEAEIISASNQFQNGSTGAQVWVGTWAGTGRTCATGEATAASTGCPPGQVQGTFNGSTICLPGGTTTGTQATGTTSKTSTNGDGSTTTTTTTNNTSCTGDGSCSTTTTTSSSTTPAAGGTPTTTPPVTETKKQDQKSFCDLNPNATVCKPFESSFNGSCTGLPACSGDAIQCAQAQAAWETNCALHPDASSLSDLGNTLAAGTDAGVGANPALAANRTVHDLSASIDQSRFLGSTCLSDFPFTLMGHSFAIPFSKLCEALGFMGLIVVTFSLIAASKIVGVF